MGLKSDNTSGCSIHALCTCITVFNICRYR